MWDSRNLRFDVRVPDPGLRIVGSPEGIHTLWGHLEDYINGGSRYNKYCDVLLRRHFREGYREREVGFGEVYKNLWGEWREKEERKARRKERKYSVVDKNNNNNGVPNSVSRGRRGSKSLDSSVLLPLAEHLLTMEKTMTSPEILALRREVLGPAWDVPRGNSYVGPYRSRR